MRVTLQEVLGLLAAMALMVGAITLADVTNANGGVTLVLLVVATVAGSLIGQKTLEERISGKR